MNLKVQVEETELKRKLGMRGQRGREENQESVIVTKPRKECVSGGRLANSGGSSEDIK